MDRDDLLDGFGEGGDGPPPAGDQFPALARQEVEDALLAGLGEADVGLGAECEVAGTAVHADALSPGLGEVSAGGTLDPEGESAGAAAVGVASGFLYGLDEARGESVGSFGHGSGFLRAVAGQHKMCGNGGVCAVPGWNSTAL